MKITIFSEELRECLNAAGLSDCGENDTWNYWYQRLMNAYNECVERQIMTEQAENSKLRKLVRDYERCTMHADCSRCEYDGKLSTHCPLSPCFPDTDELDEMVDASDSADDRCDKPRDLAARIRKLAKKEKAQ